MAWRQIGAVALLVTAASASAAAERAREPLRPEPLKDAHDRQRAEEYRKRVESQSLLPPERRPPLGDVRQAVPPPRGYTAQPTGVHNFR